MKPSAASWSATPRTQVLNPNISCTTTTTGAFVLRSGYTTHTRTLSPPSTGTIAHSACRGDEASRAATVSAPAGMDGSSTAVAALAGVAAWAAAAGVAGTRTAAG